MESLYCGHFATLEIGAGRQDIVCSAGHLQFVSSSSSKQSSVDSSLLLFTCKVCRRSDYDQTHRNFTESEFLQLLEICTT